VSEAPLRVLTDPRATLPRHLSAFSTFVFLAVVMSACGGGSSGTSSPPSPPPATVSITSVSNTSPIPFTSVQISTSGLDVNSAVTVQLSDGLGYSVTEPAIRVTSTGTVVAAIPPYIAKGTQTIGPGTVSIVIQQGSITSNSMMLNVQDLPPLSAYNVTPGQISHAMFQMQATLIGRRLNEFQSFQAATGNTVDSSQAQAHLNALLNATIQARSDVDRVTLSNTVVVPGGTLPDGNTIQFDQTTLDLMDRIQAIFLGGTFGNLVTQPTPAIQTKKQYARLRSHSNRSLLPTTEAQKFGTRFNSAPSGVASSPQEKSSNNAHADGSTIQDLNNILQTMQGINNIKDITEGTQGLTNAQNLSDAVAAFGTGAGAVNSILSDNTNFGMIAAVMSTYNVTHQCWGDVGAWIIAEASGNQAVANLAVQDMESIPLSTELKALQDLTLAFAPIADLPITPGISTVLNFAENAVTYFKEDNSGNSEAGADYQTQLSVVNSDGPVFSSPTQGLLEATGIAAVTSNLGIQAPQSGIEISPGPNGDIISTVADPGGDYDMFLPIGVPTFDYAATTFSVYDPITGNILDTIVVELTGLSTIPPTIVPPMQGTCNDPDVGDPNDSDDPDCD
jgi:hypothetical protein